MLEIVRIPVSFSYLKFIAVELHWIHMIWNLISAVIWYSAREFKQGNRNGHLSKI